jgi:hypothetical protein
MQVTPNKGLNHFIFLQFTTCMGGTVVEGKNVMAKFTGSNPDIFLFFRRMFNLNLH